MDDTPAKENPQKDFNKLDLSQLQGFSFGTQWTQDKSSPSESRERSDRPRRDGGPDRREGPGGGAPDRRDRRAFRKPAGGEQTGGSGSAGGPPVGGGGYTSEAPARREYSGERGPRREFQGGPRREGPGDRGGPRQGGYGFRDMQDRGPYESPLFNVAFYPEDTSFSALAKTIRTSCRTIELFEIARTVIGKPDRFVVVLTRKSASSESARAGSGAEPAGAAATKQAIYLSVPDGIPFESDEAALSHVLTHHLGRFFDLAEVEVEPPKGNFQVINKCGITGELLGPPNYHRYQQIVQQHYTSKISRMPLEAFRSRIETVRDPEVVTQWLEKMKKTTRYTWKHGAKPAAAAAPANPAATVAPEASVATDSAEAPIAAAAAAEVAAQEGSTTPESAPALTFDAFEDARTYLLTHAREKLVRPVDTARFHGKLLETMPPGEIQRAVEGALERQRRFPLDTANALRGRLRREHFTIFKKGSKGISYVCAVKRKFRVPGQTFAESISALISFIEMHPMVRASELPAKFLGIELPAAPKPVETVPAETSGEAHSAPAPAPTEPVLTIDQRAKLSRMQGDLRWLVTEGYVTEFIDGRLFAPPPVVEARKKEAEVEEHDPENFPEAPPAEKAAPVAPAPSPAAAPDAVAASIESMPSDPVTQEASPIPNPPDPVEPAAPAIDGPPAEAETAPATESPAPPAEASAPVAAEPGSEEKPAPSQPA